MAMAYSSQVHRGVKKRMKLNKLGTDNVNVCNALFYLPSAVTLVGEGWPGPCLPEKPLSFILNLEERMIICERYLYSTRHTPSGSLVVF